jgi:hypothetical protein
MRGVITHREVVRNLGLIAREFGLGCLLRCLYACAVRRETTFLEVAFKKEAR